MEKIDETGEHSMMHYVDLFCSGIIIALGVMDGVSIYAAICKLVGWS